MNPKSGKVKLVASGFLGTVDLAVANNGDIYVAQLFAGQISKIKAGSRQGQALHASAALPGAVEWTKDALYATVNALPGEDAQGQGDALPVVIQHGERPATSRTRS